MTRYDGSPASEQVAAVAEGGRDIGPRNRILYGAHRLRAVWRILIYLLLFLVFAIAAQLVLTPLPPPMIFLVGPAVLLVAALGAGWILVSRVENKPIGALGFAITSATPREVVVGFVIGGALLAAVALLLIVTRAAAWGADTGGVGDYLGMFLGSLLFFTVAAAWEEAFFRGYPFQVLVEAIGAWPAIVASSAVFALAHGQNPEVTALALGNIFLASILLAIAYLRTRSLWFATALHTGWNWVMAFVLDLPVSGLTAFDTPGYSGFTREPDWWSGGTFGPEAGLAATIVLLLGIVWLLRTPRARASPQMLELGPIVDRRLHHGWP